MKDKLNLAYIIGVALGDGNLSNPNGRAVRLRVTCDAQYTKINNHIISSIQKLLPQNKVSVANRGKNCIEISCYSNQWPKLLGWKVGSKFSQKVKVPTWIKKDDRYIKKCLRGLFETDGCIYNDRGYVMTNFVTNIPTLAKDVGSMISRLGFKFSLHKWTQDNLKIKHTFRIAKNAGKFNTSIGLQKIK